MRPPSAPPWTSYGRRSGRLAEPALLPRVRQIVSPGRCDLADVRYWGVSGEKQVGKRRISSGLHDSRPQLVPKIGGGTCVDLVEVLAQGLVGQDIFSGSEQHPYRPWRRGDGIVGRLRQGVLGRPEEALNGLSNGGHDEESSPRDGAHATSAASTSQCRGPPPGGPYRSAPELRRGCQSHAPAA
jgi:hypothetical protein